MPVRIVDSCDTRLLARINELIPQLSSSTGQLSADFFDSFLAQDGVVLFGYFSDDDHLLGMLTLVTFTIPTGMRAWVEDVVVDSAARGQGVGQQLVEAAVTHAYSMGAKSVDLTSRPSREAANRLYQRCGFELRETNVYRFNPAH